MKMQITNPEEIQTLLNGIPIAFRAQIQKTIIRSATTQLVRAVRSTTPVSPKPHYFGKKKIMPKTLQKSMGLVDVRRSKTVAMSIEARRPGKNYIHFVALDRKVFSLQGDRTRKGNPWISSAWASGESEVKRKLNEESKAIFEKAVIKLKAKGKL